MRGRIACLLGIAAFLGGGGSRAWGEQKSDDKTAPVTSAREADREAIVQAGRDFAAAFEKGDAKAVAGFWTEQGEYESEDGVILRGRAELEKAFAAHFKSHPSSKMEIQVESVRFPSRDIAVEEGLTRTISGTSLPDSTYYRTVHVREDGKWKMALSRDWGASEIRIADLDWLIGTWRSQEKDKEKEMSITFAREKSGPFLVGEFSLKKGAEFVPIGTMKVGLDPKRGGFNSWHFDPDGGFGNGVWLRQGSSWVIDSTGRQADGVETASVNILTRYGSDEIGWRAIDRVIGGRPQPDSTLIKLSRVPKAK